MTDYRDEMAIARAAVAEGAELLASAERGAVQLKGDRDFVTDLDRRIEEHIRGFLDRETSGVGFLGEESDDGSVDPGTGRVWALDPIDGTSNYVHGLPLCAVSLGLIQDGVPTVGVVSAPFLGMEYFAAEGGGGFCNGRRIHASDCGKLRDAIVSIGDYATGADAEPKNVRRLGITTALAAGVERVRMFGSAALDLVWVAEGRTDACVSLSNKPWDTAAGVVIARESGAVVVELGGGAHSSRSDSTIAVGRPLAAQLLGLIERVA
ncbi:inositol monophosphatase family protein [Nocardia wallacei]|uniref:inositol monophosphatase family protein n=1 Tax=Nocardia wallacei TaxID=480035 RepID=UPI0024549F01|nr:inositol monophosphatase family protein [Nocardia wallacei]